MSRVFLHAPEQGFAFNETVFGLLTAAVIGLAGILSVGVFVHG